MRSYDNALAESSVGLFKTELYRNPATLARNGSPWKGLDDPELVTCAWVAWFNTERLLAAAMFAHESAAFGVRVLAGVGGDVGLGCRAGVGSGCAEEAGERGDGFEQQGVEAGLLVGGAAGAEPGDGAAVPGLGGKLADPGGHGGVGEGGRAARGGAASRG